MKIITFPKILTLIWVAVAIFFFYKLDFLGAFALSIAVGIICLAIQSSHNDRILEKKSFKNPNTISKNDACQMYRVADINGDKIGLIKWGYKKNSVGDLRSYRDYYFISGIPTSLRKINIRFQINSNENSFIFYKIEVNINNRKKKPFEILNRIYTV